MNQIVYVVTANHDLYGCGCFTPIAVCATEEIAEQQAGKYEAEYNHQMIQTFIEEMSVISTEEQE